MPKKTTTFQEPIDNIEDYFDLKIRISEPKPEGSSAFPTLVSSVADSCSYIPIIKETDLQPTQN